VHRDLKPENILLTDADEMLPEIKIIDFGTAKKFKYHEFDDNTLYPIGLKERVGTLNYMAPEILKLGDHKNKGV
jgi:serine/threonine protein kinase